MIQLVRGWGAVFARWQGSLPEGSGGGTAGGAGETQTEATTGAIMQINIIHCANDIHLHRYSLHRVSHGDATRLAVAQ